MAVRIAHLCINTKNLEACREFYCEILGFKKIFNFTKNGKVVGFYLEISKNNFIEFFEDASGYPPKSALTHFCLETKDIYKEEERLSRHGITMTKIKLGVDQTWQFWFSDPNGIAIEFHQYTKKSSQRTRKDVEIDW